MGITERPSTTEISTRTLSTLEAIAAALTFPVNGDAAGSWFPKA
jgi:hypothetical protein